MIYLLTAIGLSPGGSNTDTLMKNTDMRRLPTRIRSEK